MLAARPVGAEERDKRDHKLIGENAAYSRDQPCDARFGAAYIEAWSASGPLVGNLSPEQAGNRASRYLRGEASPGAPGLNGQHCIIAVGLVNKILERRENMRTPGMS